MAEATGVERNRQQARDLAEATGQRARDQTEDIETEREVQWAVTQLRSSLDSRPTSLHRAIVEAQPDRGILRGLKADIRSVALAYEAETGEAVLDAVDRVYAWETFVQLATPDSPPETISEVINEVRTTREQWNALSDVREDLKVLIGGSFTEMQSSPTPERWEIEHVERARAVFTPRERYSGELRHINPEVLAPMPVQGQGGIRTGRSSFNTGRSPPEPFDEWSDCSLESKLSINFFDSSSASL